MGRAWWPSRRARAIVAWPIGQAAVGGAVVGARRELVATAVGVAAPALAAMVVAELALALVGRVQPALGRAVDAAPLRALAVLLVAGGGGLLGRARCSRRR